VLVCRELLLFFEGIFILVPIAVMSFVTIIFGR
jgi:hypothetical protein